MIRRSVSGRDTAEGGQHESQLRREIRQPLPAGFESVEQLYAEMVRRAEVLSKGGSLDDLP
jgi:hypothetical protein